MRPVLFLDFDGVLNHQAHMLGLRQGRTQADVAIDDQSFDKACVERVNSIVEATGADVVISSSWRHMFGLSDLRGILRRHGFRGRVVGATPLHGHNERGDEIQAWMARHGMTAERIVIIDDNDDMEHLSPRLVLTNMGTGITDADAARAVTLLSS